MVKLSNISPKEIRSRSAPPSRLAAQQEPDRKAVLKPAAAVILAVSPSHTAGIATRPGSASRARRRSGAVMAGFLGTVIWRHATPERRRAPNRAGSDQRHRPHRRTRGAAHPGRQDDEAEPRHAGGGEFLQHQVL